MKAMQNLQTVLDQRLELISAYFDRLTPRDRVLAIFLVIFVLVSSIGAALWYTLAACAGNIGTHQTALCGCACRNL
jgi:hypothetical protein